MISRQALSIEQTIGSLFPGDQFFFLSQHPEAFQRNVQSIRSSLWELWNKPECLTYFMQICSRIITFPSCHWRVLGNRTKNLILLEDQTIKLFQGEHWRAWLVQKFKYKNLTVKNLSNLVDFSFSVVSTMSLYASLV